MVYHMYICGSPKTKCTSAFHTEDLRIHGIGGPIPDDHNSSLGLVCRTSVISIKGLGFMWGPHLRDNRRDP